MITVILGLAAVEFYDRVTEKGYRPAVVPGIAACVAAPLAAYWIGDARASARDRVRVHGGVGQLHRRPQRRGGPDAERLDHHARHHLDRPARFVRGADPALLDDPGAIAGRRGTDTLFLLALGVVANDIGALFVGSAAGRTPLRPWISPQQDGRGVHRRGADDDRGDGRRRHRRVERHVEVAEAPVRCWRS